MSAAKLEVEQKVAMQMLQRYQQGLVAGAISRLVGWDWARLAPMTDLATSTTSC